MEAQGVQVTFVLAQAGMYVPLCSAYVYNRDNEMIFGVK